MSVTIINDYSYEVTHTAVTYSHDITLTLFGAEVLSALIRYKYVHFKTLKISYISSVRLAGFLEYGLIPNTQEITESNVDLLFASEFRHKTLDFVSGSWENLIKTYYLPGYSDCAFLSRYVPNLKFKSFTNGINQGYRFKIDYVLVFSDSILDGFKFVQTIPVEVINLGSGYDPIGSDSNEQPE